MKVGSMVGWMDDWVGLVRVQLGIEVGSEQVLVRC